MLRLQFVGLEPPFFLCIARIESDWRQEMTGRVRERNTLENYPFKIYHNVEG